MSRRPLTLMALMAVLGVAVFGMPSLSGATFTSTSRNTASSISAASDWVPPTVTMINPGTTVSGTAATIAANASDTGSGIASVVIQYLAPGASTWTTMCTASGSPYSCSWNTKLVADGSYDLRAIATDNAGYQTTSDTVTTQVANNLLLVLNDPGDVVKGNVTLNAAIYNPGSLVYVVSVQYLVTGSTGSWKTLCTMTVTAPYTCTWATATGYTQGESYDLRAVATSGTTTVYSATVTDALIDNVAPVTAMTDPGTPLRGTATFTATASDADTSVTSVQIQYQKSGTGTWTTMCTLSVDPYTCRYDTTKLSDGVYSFRSFATDQAGNTTASTVIASRTVDNTVSSVSMEDPGAYLSGTVTLTATAASTAGVTSVRIDRAPNGSSTWTTVCTDTTSPYSCSLNTTTLADGLYDFRATLVDGAGKTTVSTTMAARRIDNTPLKAYDVQATNGGAKVGRLDAGDKLTFTFTDQVNLASIMTGWTGTSTAVSLRLRDGNAVTSGLGGSNDTVDVLSGSTVLNLGSVNLKGNFIKNNKTAVFAATMVASTATVNGTSATVVTVTVGAMTSGGSLRTATSSQASIWTPSVSALDTNGRPCSAAPATELGTNDKDF
ncbi:Ig-like domain-containing protein [Nocardioides marmorisolisilvae]|uniref:Signal peptidase I n=1 Tax=Nocardioides marmorisolisilvae TaxID=1542737 RepID=A0A3N0DSL9_9ACTN|nr:Ig-like domain-containing protein [Nocardioides marmorisolisilvae]RNL78511.1 signal peptidase I [Nocardioides marmorisolisilvae]